MEPTQELASQLHHERIIRAQRMTPGQKLAAGLQLYALAIECMRAGIRLQHPAADEAQIRNLIRQRLDHMRRKDEVIIDGSC